MGFFPFALQFLPLSGGTLTGVLNTAGIANTGQVTSTGDFVGSGVAGVNVPGNIRVGLAGDGLQIKEGANAKQGTAVLVAGSVVVADTAVTANSRILVTSNLDGGTPGFVRVSARVAGTSFTVTSSSGTDTSTVAYEIFEPG